MKSETIVIMLIFLLIYVSGRLAEWKKGLTEIRSGNTVALDQFFGLLLNGEQTTCTKYVNRKTSNLSALEKRPLDLVQNSLSRQPNPKLLMQYSMFNYSQFMINELCDLFIIVTDDLQCLDNILNLKRMAFKPFSRLLIIFNGLADAFAFLNRKNILRINNKKALDVMLIQFDFQKLSTGNDAVQLPILHYTSQMTIKRLTLPLGSSEMKAAFAEDFFLQEEYQPIFEDGMLDVFQVNMFNCPPFVINIWDPHISDNEIYDGVEYKFLMDITRGWRINFRNLEKNCRKCEIWYLTRMDFIKNASDILLCSLWMNEINKVNIEYSTFYDQQCVTFIVPKTKAVNPASYIYIALEGKVWLNYLSYLFITGFLLTLLTVLGIKVNKAQWMSSNFLYLSSSFTEVINIATSHGLRRFPLQKPLKILLISWMILSLIISTGYSTGYTSLLTHPKHTKPINTVVDMLEQKIRVGFLYATPQIKNELVKSHNENYIALSKNFVLEKESGRQYKNAENMKNAHMIKLTLHKNMVGADDFIEFYPQLRLMTDCLFRVYTVFGFQRGSPYTQYFNKWIARYFEMGIFQHWFNEAKYKYSPISTYMFFDPEVDRFPNRKAKKLTLQNLTSVFILLVVGLLFSVLVFFGEIAYSMIFDKNKQRVLEEDPAIQILV